MHALLLIAALVTSTVAFLAPEPEDAPGRPCAFRQMSPAEQRSFRLGELATLELDMMKAARAAIDEDRRDDVREEAFASLAHLRTHWVSWQRTEHGTPRGCANPCRWSAR